jgi:hypothetical protein
VYPRTIEHGLASIPSPHRADMPGLHVVDLRTELQIMYVRAPQV